MFLDKYLKIDPKNKIAIGAITIVELVAMWKLYKFGKNEYEYWKRVREYEKIKSSPVLPSGQYQLPGASTVQTGSINVYKTAKDLYDAYNPTGWNTDEGKMFSVLGSLPPQYFQAVSDEYFKIENGARDLMTDLNEQLTGVYSYPWHLYKTEVQNTPQIIPEPTKKQ